MANELKSEQKAQAISLLCEGNSIRSIERITDIQRPNALMHGAIWTANRMSGHDLLPYWKFRQSNPPKLPCAFKSLKILRKEKQNE